MKAAFPLGTADVRAVMAALGVGARAVARAEYSARRAHRRGGRADRGVGWRSRCTSGARTTRSAAAWRSARHARPTGRDADDRRRVGGPGARDRGRARARPGLAPERQPAARAQDARRASARAASRSSTSARTRSSSTSASASRTASGRRSSTAPRSPGWARVSTRPAGSATRRSSGPSTRSRRWPRRPAATGVEAIAAVGTAGLRHRRPTAPSSSTPCASAPASRSRSSRARRRAGSPTSR